MKDIDALTLVVERYCRSRDYFQPWHENYKNKWYRAWRGVPDETKFPYRNQVFDKISYTIVEVVTARIMQTVFQSRPIISVLPQEGSDRLLAKQVEKVLANLLDNPSAELFQELNDWVKQCVIAGTSYLKVQPDFELNGKNIDFKGLSFSTIDYCSGFPDPDARRNSQARFFIERQLVSLAELEELQKAGIYSNVEGLSRSNDTLNNEVKNRLAELGIASGLEFHDPTGPQVELLHHYADGDIITVAGMNTVLRDSRKESGKNPNRVMPYATPVIDIRYCTAPREYMGVGVPEQLEQDQEYTNLVRSATLDNFELIINKIFKMKIGGATDPEDVISAPGQLIPVGEPDDVTEFQMHDIAPSTFRIQEGLDKKTQDVTGEYEYGRGAAPDRKETATGITRLQEATLGRFDVTMKLFEFSGMRMVGQKGVEIMRRFMPEEMFLRILGPKLAEQGTQFYQTDVNELLNQYDIAPVGSTVTANKALKAEQAMQAWSVSSSIPPEVQQAGGFKVNLYEGLKKVYDSLNQDPDTWIEKVEPPQGQGSPQNMGAPSPQGMPQQGQALPLQLVGGPNV